MSGAAVTMDDSSGLNHRESETGVIALDDSASSVRDIRHAVRAGMMDALGFRPDESVQHLSEVGSPAFCNPVFDVITVDFDAVYRVGPVEASITLLRRCRPGGRIGLARATPGSFLARVQQAIKRHTADPELARRPGLPGTRASLGALFDGQAYALGASDGFVKLYYSSPEHWLARWQLTYGPLKRACQRTDPDWRNQFSEELIQLVQKFTEVDAGGRFIRCDYLGFLVHKSVKR